MPSGYGSHTTFLHNQLYELFDNIRSGTDKSEAWRSSVSAAESIHVELLKVLDSSRTDLAASAPKDPGVSPSALLEFYMTYFPSPAVYIFESILDDRRDLQEAYDRYLTQLAREIRETLLCGRTPADRQEEEGVIRVALQHKNMLPTPVLQEKLSQLLRSPEKRSGRSASQTLEDYPTFCNRLLRELMRKNPLLPDAGTAGKRSSLEILTEDFRGALKEGRFTEYQAAMLQEDCLEPLRKFQESEWRTKLHAKKGYDFFGNNSLLTSLRNTVFHLAFQLKLNPATVSRILTKCLLQPDFNVKDHREVIYLWCLHRNISYGDMIRDYFIPYHSPEFARCYRDLKFNDMYYYKTTVLFDQLGTILKTPYATEGRARDAFLEYLQKLYRLERNILNGESICKRIEISRSHLRDEIFRFIFRTDPQLALSKQYTDYTLRTPQPGVSGVQPVADHFAFYTDYLEDRLTRRNITNSYYRETVEKQLLPRLIAEKALSKDRLPRVREDLKKPLSRFRNSPWTKPALKQYHDFLGRDVLIYSIRNVLYHLAFALDMEPEDVQQILDKCLLTPQWDPTDHLEVIYRWCLKQHISYSDMVQRYILPYHTSDFDRSCQQLRPPLFLRNDPESLRETFEEILNGAGFETPRQQEEAFLLYLRKIKVMEHMRRNSGWQPTEIQLRRKTPRQVFSEYFDYLPTEEGYDDGTDSFIYTYGNSDWPGADTVKQRADLFDPDFDPEDAGEDDAPEEETGDNIPEAEDADDAEASGSESHGSDIRQRLDYLQMAREDYYARNEEPLLPLPLLTDLFRDLDFSPSLVIKRRTGSVSISRKLLVAVIFIGYLCYEPMDEEIDRMKWDRFAAECTEVLQSAGLYPFYERNPFELFLVLCFLTKDPLGYFMSNWAHYLKYGPKTK